MANSPGAIGSSLANGGVGLLPGLDTGASTPPSPSSTTFAVEIPKLSHGTSALGTAVSVAPVNGPGNCATEIGIDWINKVHVIRRSYAFGNILGTINNDITVFSSYRDQTVTWTAFVNNVGTGLSITDIPSLPTVINPLSGLTMNLQVTTQGTPQFDTTLDFTFDVSSVSVPVTGSRVITFPYRPEAPITETLSFLTEVLEHKDGTEQRISLRKNPRQSFTFKYRREEGVERSRIDFLVFGWQARAFGIPMWHEPMLLTSATAVNDTTINVSTTNYTDLRVGGLAVVLLDDDVTFDTLEISSLTATSITFSSGVQNIYPVGTRVYPIRIAFADKQFSGARFPVNAGDFDIRFKVSDNDTSIASTAAFNTYNSKVLLDDANFIKGQLRETYAQNIKVFDNKTGDLDQDSAWPSNRRSHAKTFSTGTRQALWEARQLLHALRGRQISFWIPTFFEEITPIADLAGGNNTMTITNVGYAQFVSQKKSKNVLRVVQTDGTTVIREITASSETSDTVEQLTLDSNWPSTILVSSIERVEILEPVRLDSDDVTFTHKNAKGEADITFPIKAVID